MGYEKTFNDILIQFVQTLNKIHPKDNFEGQFSQLNNIINICPTKLIELFIIRFLPDKDKLLSNDDAFFLNKYTNDSPEISNKKESNISFINEIKQIWITLEDDHKTLIRLYLKILCEHSENYLICCNKFKCI